MSCQSRTNSSPRHTFGYAWVFIVLLVVLAASPEPLAAQSPDLFAGHWEGAIKLPNADLVIKVDLALDGEVLSGTIDIPQQGAAGLPLDKIEVSEGSIQFSMGGVPGDPTFHGQLKDGEIMGDFTQGPARFPFTLGRDEVAKPARPQEPEPPFPYDEEEVSYSNGDITLAGTLTMPRGDGPFPAAILITGSGAQDRDESLLGHKPFLVIADRLTRAGIAVLRVDDRGVGGSSGSVLQSTTEDFAGDVLAGIEFLSARDGIDPEKVGVIGHSEGGLVAPLAASKSESIAFVVMLAGTGVPGSEVLILQLERTSEAEGVAPEIIDKQLALQNELIELLASDRSNDEIEAPFRELVGRQIDLAEKIGANPQDVPREQIIDQSARQTLNPWFRFFVTYDPRPALANVKVPVLALNGSLDTQVDAEQNLPEIKKALEKGGNEDITVKTLPGLNHLFQNATTGAFSEYAQIEETFDEETLAMIANWIVKRFG